MFHNGHAHQQIAIIQLHGNFSIGFDVGEIRQAVTAHVPRRGGKHDGALIVGLHTFRQGQDGTDALVRLDVREHLHNRPPPRLRRGGGQIVNFQVIHFPQIAEKQQRRVGAGNMNGGHKIIGFGVHAAASFAAAFLGAIGRQRHAFDIPVVGHGDNHVFPLDQILDVDFAGVFHNFSAAGGAVFFLNDQHFGFHQGQQLVAVAQQGHQILDFGHNIPQVGLQFFTLQTR